MAKLVFHWKDPGPAARWTLVAVVVSAAGNAAFAAVDWYYRSPPEAGEPAVGLYDVLSTLLSLLTTLALIPGCFWLYRVTANARSWEPSMTHSPASAWVWFLVPIAHFFMPFKVLSEVYRASGAPSRLPLIAFWIVNVISVASIYAYMAVAFRSMLDGTTPLWADLGLTGVGLAVHPFFAWLVVDLTRAQQDTTRIAEAFEDGEAPQPA